MTIFNIDQYQQTYKRDWNGFRYDTTEIQQNVEPLENSHNKVSAGMEVLEAGEQGGRSDKDSSDRWNPAHFGEVPRKLDSNGNPTIFWDESIEPPDPDDFKSLQEYEKAWQQWEENSDNSICVAELERDFLSQESSPEKSTCADSAKSTPGVEKYCNNDFPESPSTTTLENSQESRESTALHHRHRVNLLPLKENAWVEPITETAYPQYCDSSAQSNPNSFVSKTYPDCYLHPNILEKNPEHILNRCSGSFASVGMMHNGLLSERDLNLEPDGLVKDSCSLPRPGALSWSGNGRPPGNTKSEAKAKKLGLIGKNEVFNPEWLEQEFGLPIGWTDPQEHRAATELIALEEQPSETVSTPGLVKSSGGEYFTSTHLSVKEQSGNYNTTTPNTLKAISLWQPYCSLIPLGLKNYETRSWKTKYRGKLLICSTAKSTKIQYQQYLKICNELELPAWNEINFPHGYALAVCDLVDCIEMTPEFIAQQSQTELKSGDWQIGRYAWKLENVQPITEPLPIKGKQGLFNVSVDLFQSQKDNSGDKEESSPSKNNLSPSKNSLSNLLRDKKESSPSNNPLHSPSKNDLSPSKNSLSNLLGDGEEGSPSNNLGDKEDSSPSKIISPSNSPSNLLGDNEENSPSKIGLSPELDSPSNLLGDNEENNPSKKRLSGEGNGYIHWRTITKNGKKYPQAYYHWKEGNKKRSKYIPKKLFGSVENAESAKRPVIEILKLLDVATNSSNLLGDEENSPELSDANADISKGADKLLGYKWINNGEINISQGFDGSPSNSDSSPSKIELSPSKRRKGEGSGSIHWRTITRGGKDYPQAYYHYELWNRGDRGSKAERLVKSSKYIPKGLLSQVQRLEAQKAPVKKILRVLGIYL